MQTPTDGFRKKSRYTVLSLKKEKNSNTHIYNNDIKRSKKKKNLQYYLFTIKEIKSFSRTYLTSHKGREKTHYGILTSSIMPGSSLYRIDRLPPRAVELGQANFIQLN